MAAQCCAPIETRGWWIGAAITDHRATGQGGSSPRFDQTHLPKHPSLLRGPYSSCGERLRGAGCGGKGALYLQRSVHLRPPILSQLRYSTPSSATRSSHPTPSCGEWCVRCSSASSQHTASLPLRSFDIAEDLKAINNRLLRVRRVMNSLRGSSPWPHVRGNCNDSSSCCHMLRRRS